MPAAAPLLLLALPAALAIGLVASRAIVAVPAGERFAVPWPDLRLHARTVGGVTAMASVAVGSAVIAVSVPAVYWPAAGWLLFLGVTLSIIDLRHHRLPDRLTLPGLPVLMVTLLLPAITEGRWDAWGRALAGAAVLYGIYLLGWLFAGMGYGDVKLAPTVGAIAAWLGWEHLAVGLVASLAVAVVAGAVASGVKATRVQRGQRWSSLRSMPLAFGPAMFVGTLVAVVWSEPIVEWYLTAAQ